MTNFCLVQPVSEQEHELCNGALGRTVVAADNAGLKKMQAGFVTPHLYAAALALSDVDYDDAALCGIL